MSVTGRIVDWLLLIGGALLIWQGAHWLVGEFALASPLITFQTLFKLFDDPDFWTAAQATGLAFGLALALAIVGGMALGLWLGLHRFAGEVGEPLVVTLYSLPKITLYPVFLLAFGLTLQAKVFFGALHGIIPIAIFTIGAVRTIRPVYFKTARALSLSFRSALTRVYLPSVLPEIFTGIRVGFSLTLLGVLVSDLFASRDGLGAMILNAVEDQDLETLLAVAVFLALFALICNSILLAVDRHLHRGLESSR